MTRLSVLVLVATVAALLAGCDSGETDTTLPSQTPEQPSTTPPPSGTLEVAEPPQAPDDTRFVGKGRIVVAVPTSWSTNDTRCGQPLSDTVVFESVSRPVCHLPSQPFSYVHIVGTESKQGREWLSATIVRRQHLDGVTVTRSVAVDDLMVNGHTRVILTAPEEGVAVMIAASTGQEMDKIANSVRVLPEGYVTVPDVSRLTGTEAQGILQEASLTYRTTVHPPCPSGFSDCDFVVGATAPVAGSVVETGAIVTVTAAAGDTSPPGPSELTCQSDLRAVATIDDFGPFDSNVGLTDAAKLWAEDGDDIHIASREDTVAVVFIVRPDGTAHTELNMRWKPDRGWYLSTFESCPKGAPGAGR